MNTIEITKYISPYQRSNIFKGVFACNNLPTRIKLPALMIVNLSKNTESGTHWVAIYIDKSRNGYYFDSFGMPPRNNFIIHYLETHVKKLNFNNKQLQHISSVKCGKYCCIFAISILKYRTIDNFINKFSKNLFINEFVIENMYNNLNRK